MAVEQEYLSQAEVATLLGISTRRVRQLEAEGRLPKPSRLTGRPRYSAYAVTRAMERGRRIKPKPVRREGQ